MYFIILNFFTLKASTVNQVSISELEYPMLSFTQENISDMKSHTVTYTIYRCS